mmetsp:Transcript_37550/g.98619  ORF Transcript_37550/g.98619 Transcript_37550/m.98619 type:complete len:222 (-) Transcript_37550:1573-2238(-)
MGATDACMARSWWRRVSGRADPRRAKRRRESGARSTCRLRCSRGRCAPRSLSSRTGRARGARPPPHLRRARRGSCSRGCGRWAAPWRHWRRRWRLCARATGAARAARLPAAETAAPAVKKRGPRSASCAPGTSRFATSSSRASRAAYPCRRACTPHVKSTSTSCRTTSCSKSKAPAPSCTPPNSHPCTPAPLHPCYLDTSGERPTLMVDEPTLLSVHVPHA